MSAFTFNIRTATFENTPGFHLTDVVRALGIIDPKRVLALLDEDEFFDLAAVTGDMADAGTMASGLLPSVRCYPTSQLPDARKWVVAMWLEGYKLKSRRQP